MVFSKYISHIDVLVTYRDIKYNQEWKFRNGIHDVYFEASVHLGCGSTRVEKCHLCVILGFKAENFGWSRLSTSESRDELRLVSSYLVALHPSIL